MKVRFLALAAMVLGLASCQQEIDPVVSANGEVDFTLNVDAIELATRAGESGEDDGTQAFDSAYGAIDYLQASAKGDNYRVDWGDVDLRYSLEVYDAADDYTNAIPVKDRQVIIVDEYQPVSFDLRLIPNRDYRFVVFADFVKDGASADPAFEIQSTLGLHHDLGTTLGDITIKKDAINDECTDAYFATKDITISNSTSQSILLRRPYGKLRVIATDLAELNTNVIPAQVQVTYTAKHPQTFNAVTGVIGAKDETKTVTFYSEYNDGVGQGSLVNHFYTEGYDAMVVTNSDNITRHSHMTLFTDYILAVDDQQQSINFDMSLIDGNNEIIKTTQFCTEIPVQRNHLTTVIGNLLTTATEVNVTIYDNFENANRQYYVFEAFVNGGEVTLDRNYVIGRPLYVEADAVLNLNGYSITNAQGNALTDVIIVKEGGKLTINGDGVIEAVSGNDGFAVISEGELVINGGTFKAGIDGSDAPNAVIYARGNGKVYVKGGNFPNCNNSTFVLNKRDADRATTTIEVSGGVYRNFDPKANAAEGEGTNFMAPGFTTVFDGVDTYTVVAARDFEINEVDHIVYAYSANGLLKWSWLVANNDPTWSVKLMSNITMPMYTVEEDLVNETYKYTDTPVTITDGKPSGSNWVQVGTYQPTYNVFFDALVDGNGMTLSDLTIYSESLVAGFIGWCENIEVKDLTFNNATIYSTNSYVSPLAYMLDGSYIHNVHTHNSYIRGVSYVAGIAAEAMDHYDDPDKTYVHEFMDGSRSKLMPLVTLDNCSTDANTTIVGTSAHIGGIAGQAYGSMLINCHNKADVTGNGYVGGVVGYFRDYNYGQYGYIVNCSSTDCTITSSGARTGGIAGYVMEGHDGHAWVVGCYSNSTINCTKSNVGSIVGCLSGTNKIVGNYAISTLPVSGYGAADSTSFSFASAADITAENRDKMNEGVAEYNNFAANYEFPSSPVCEMPMELPSCVAW